MGVGWGDGNPDFVGEETEGDAAELDDLAGADFVFGDGLVVEEGAVGGLEIAHDDAAVVDGDFRVESGDGSFVDDDVVGGVATDGVEAASEVELKRQGQGTEMVEVHAVEPGSATGDVEEVAGRRRSGEGWSGAGLKQIAEGAVLGRTPDG